MDNVYSSFRYFLMVWNIYIKLNFLVNVMVNSNKSWLVIWLLVFENVKWYYKRFILYNFSFLFLIVNILYF